MNRRTCTHVSLIGTLKRGHGTPLEPSRPAEVPPNEDCPGFASRSNVDHCKLLYLPFRFGLAASPFATPPRCMPPSLTHGNMLSRCRSMLGMQERRGLGAHVTQFSPQSSYRLLRIGHSISGLINRSRSSYLQAAREILSVPYTSKCSTGVARNHGPPRARRDQRSSSIQRTRRWPICRGCLPGPAYGPDS